MVTGGTVRVTADSVPLSRSITVTNRNWHTNPASPGEVANGTFIVLPVPPQPVGNDSGLGYFQWTSSDNGAPWSTIGDGGPNQGYTYYGSPLTFSIFNFLYEINPDLENSSSTFSQHQCGTNGFISWSNLLSQTRRHEYNSAVQSRYALYSNSLNSNNVGDYIEQRIALPGANIAQFNTDTRAGLTSRYNSIKSASQAESSLYPVNYSETGSFLGNINYANTPCN